MHRMPTGHPSFFSFPWDRHRRRTTPRGRRVLFFFFFKRSHKGEKFAALTRPGPLLPHFAFLPPPGGAHPPFGKLLRATPPLPFFFFFFSLPRGSNYYEGQGVFFPPCEGQFRARATTTRTPYGVPGMSPPPLPPRSTFRGLIFPLSNKMRSQFFPPSSPRRRVSASHSAAANGPFTLALLFPCAQSSPLPTGPRGCFLSPPQRRPLGRPFVAPRGAVTPLPPSLFFPVGAFAMVNGRFMSQRHQGGDHFFLLFPTLGQIRESSQVAGSAPPLFFFPPFLLCLRQVDCSTGIVKHVCLGFSFFRAPNVCHGRRFFLPPFAERVPEKTPLSPPWRTGNTGRKDPFPLLGT